MTGPKSWNAVLHRLSLLGMVTIAVALGLYLIVISPVLPSAVGGDISAVLSGLALCGVAGSLVLQRRQATIDRIAAERQRHFDIISLCLNDLELLDTLNPEAAASPHARKEVYINLMMGFWATTFQTGGMSEADVRSNVRRLFVGPIGREWWGRVRHMWDDGTSRSLRRFVSAVNKEWEIADATAAREAGSRI